jgi:DNA polymerase III delta prime subunit
MSQISLQQDLYDNNRRLIVSFAPLTVQPCIVTSKQDEADLTVLDGMYHSADAGHLCENRQGCLRGTRRDVLLRLEHWLEDKQGPHVFWLNGLAGTGKSTIAQTFAEHAFAEGKLGASFFCSRDFEDRSDLRAIFPTLAFQLAIQYPLFRKEILRVLKTHLDVGRESLSSQMEKLIIGPFKATQISTVIIIDALDECKDVEPTSSPLSILSCYAEQIPSVKFFFTSRPEPQIRSGFRLRLLQRITEVFKLHEVKPEVVDSDIKLFLQTKLASLSNNQHNHSLTDDWPSSLEIEVLCKKAAGLFIYASATIEFVASKDNLPAERLALITSLPKTTIEEGKFGVDQLYVQILKQAFYNDHVGSNQLYSSFQSVVGMVLLIFNPLSINGLLELLRKSHLSSGVLSIIQSLHSVLLVPDNKEDPIHIFHKSFPDFLTNLYRCKDERFFINPPIHHQMILLSCLNLMKEKLKRNICNLDDFVSYGEVKDLPARQKTHIGDALVYACKFWTRHLLEIPSGNCDIEEVHEAINKFFTTQFPYWIEVLSLMGNLEAGIYVINDIYKWYTMVS